MADPDRRERRRNAAVAPGRRQHRVALRVLYVCHTGAVSGAERTLFELFEALPASVEPVVASPAGPMRGRVEALGVPWRELSGTSGSLKLHPVQTPLALAEMSRAALAVRAVAHRVSADLIHANSVRAGLTAGGARSLGGPPVLTHVHDHLAPGAMTTVLGAALRAGSAGYLSISGWAESGLHGRPVHRIGNPVDIERFAPGGDRIDLPAGPHLGVLAQITPWKGQLEAVSALAVVRERHPEARLLLVGEVKFAEAGTRYDNRTYLRELHAHIAGLGLGDAVEFLGEREDAPDILRSLDVLLVPSWGEPFGRSMIEAMAAGTPVVATDLGGPSEVIEDGRTGRLVPVRDPVAMGRAASELLDDDALRERIAVDARVEVTGRFSQELYAERVVEIYAATLS